MLAIGAVVDGKYKILNEIGRGGMSVVYLAINERANKTWAIKEVRKDGGTDSEVVQQGLVAETEMLKKLSHPHLPSIIDVIDRQDSFLIVMDYIEGRSLQSLLKHGGPQPSDKAIEWAKQLCDVLGYLHSRCPPIIYRDMKPANVMLKPDGSVTLIDFGTAREYKDSKQGDTTWLGTRGYAAPEQFGGHGQTDARTDIYCLGATLYHLLTGYSPADTHFEVLPLRQLNPAFAGSGIEKIVAKCCQPDPAKRYQNCAELMYALEHVHDEDDAAKRHRHRVWGGFVASIAVAVLGVFGMIGFSVARASAETRSYTAYIAQAQTAPGGITEGAAYYDKAIRLKPGDVTAYDALLDDIDNDSEFTSEESQALLSCIQDSNGNGRLYLDYLKTEDPKGYAQFIYRLANDYYFFFTESNNHANGARWYTEIQDNKNLTAQERELAASLNTIGTYYATLSSDRNAYKVGGDTYTYKNYWDDLVRLTDGDVVVKTGATAYAVALYKELVTQIATGGNNFKSYGISQEEMSAQLDKVAEVLPKLRPENETISTQIANLQTQITDARKMVNTYYGTVGATTGG